MDNHNEEKPKKRLVSTAINTNLYDFMYDKLQRDRLAHDRLVNHVRISDTDITSYYDMGHQIGQGNFGTVVSVIDKNNDKEWAMKIIPKPKSETHKLAMEREIKILKLVHHPNIIHLEKVFESRKTIFLILEKCDVELLAILKKKTRFTETEAKKTIQELMSAVSYLHKNDIVHRDLKLENILVTTNPDNEQDKLFIKIADFGLSIIKSSHERIYERCGTLIYMSPEIIRKDSYSQACDVWAVGIIMYTLMVGEVPFFAKDKRELIELICNFEPEYPPALSSGAVDLLKKLLEKNILRRITASEAIYHYWLIDPKHVAAHSTSHQRTIRRRSNSISPSDKKFTNVLDLMEQWRNDLRVSNLEDNEGVSVGLSTKPPGRASVGNEVTKKRQPLPMPIKNLEFSRRENLSTEKHKNSTTGGIEVIKKDASTNLKPTSDSQEQTLKAERSLKPRDLKNMKPSK